MSRITARIDITGQRFGRLVAKEHLPGKAGQRGGKWLCDCDCGNATKVHQYYLRKGLTISCGCYQHRTAR